MPGEKPPHAESPRDQQPDVWPSPRD
jgi:hypothetical protein